MPNLIEQQKIITELNKPVKYVACYVRVSTEEQVKFGFSIEAQKDALEKYCKEHGYKFKFFIDEGISASSMKKRKALKELLDKSYMFDMVIFTKLDRLSRNVLDANNINKILKENNCTMKAIDEDDIDTSTADGTFIFNLKVSLAQREIGKTSERINFVFKNKREKGEVTSGQKKYGYDIVDKHFKINPTEAENLLNLYKFNISVNGDVEKTYGYFVEHFDGKGYDAMIHYLTDTAYIGKYKLYRKEIYLDNYIPAIIPEDIWYKVQDLRPKKTIATNIDVEDIFSGLVYCNNCKSRMYRKVDNRTKNTVIRYCCNNAYTYKKGTKIKKCTNNATIREEDIEQYLLENLFKEFNKYKLNAKIEKEVVTSSNPQKIKQLEKRILKLKDLYLDDLIDKETYKKDYTKYTKEIEKLKEAKIITENRDLSHIEKLLNSNYIDIYSKLTTTNKKKFWLSVIDKIYVEKRQIKEVTFK